MAERQTLQVGLSITADTSKARQELQKLKDDLTKTISTAKIGENTTPSFDKAIAQATQLRGILEGASDATGKFDLTKFRHELDRSGLTMDQVFTSLQKIGATDAFNRLASQIQNSSSKVSILDGAVKDFFNGLKNVAAWTIQSNAIHAVESALSSAYSYAQKLNKGLTDIAIVSDLNTQQLTEFARTANQMAKELSANTADYISGALIYYQAGLTDEQVIERTNTTIKLAQTSGESAEQISSYMTAIWNNFYDGSKSVEYYADAISYLGAVTAASNADIAEGMQAFAAVANTVGLSFEYGASALTLLRDITQQSASTIGNSLKTIFARLSSVAQGDTLEDGVDLTKYSKALDQVGVSVLDVNGNLREMDDILDDLGTRWDTLNNAQKVALAQTVGGVRQYNNLISLMDNYEKFQELTNEAAGSEGYLNHQAAEYAESWEAASNRLQAAWQKIYDQLIDDKFFIKLTDFITWIVNGIGNIIDGLGGLKGLLPMLVMAFTSFSPKDTAAGLEKVVQQLKDLKEAITGAATTANEKLKALTASLQIGDKLISSNPEVMEMADRLNQAIEHRNDLITKGNVVQAAALDASIQRYAKEFDAAAKVANVLERINNDYALMGADKAELRKTANLTKKQDASIERLQNAKNFKEQRTAVFNMRKNAKNGPFDASVYDGLSENIDQITKKQIQQVIANMNSALAANAAKLEAAFEEIDLKAKLEEIVGQADASAKGEVLTKTFEKVKQELKDITDETERWEKAQKIVEADMQLDAEAAKQLGVYMAGAAKTAENFKVPEPPTTDWSVMATNTIRAASALGTINGIVDGVSQAFKELESGSIGFGDFLTRLTSSATSAVYAFNTLTTAVQAFGVAEKTATTIGLVLVGVLAAIKFISYAFNKETEDLKKAAEEQRKINEEQKASINTTNDLANSVMDLVSAYQELSEAGGDTFDTLNNLKEQAPKLIEQYEELADTLGEDWGEEINQLRLAYEKGIDTGNWDDFIELNDYLQTLTTISNTENAQNKRQTALDTLKTSGNGTLQNGNYQTTLWGSEEDYKIGRETLKGFLSGTSGNSINFDANNVDEYYKALVNTIDALEKAGRANSTYYNNIKKEIAALQPAYKEYIATQKESLKAFTEDLDHLNWSDTGNDLYGMLFGDMEDYVSNENHQKLLDTVAAMYNISAEDAEQVIRNSDVGGAKERLYQRWVKELTETGDEAATASNLQQIASWYDSLPDAYKTFAITLEYDKTKINDEAYLRQLTGEAAESWRKAQFAQEGENRGFDAQEMQDYADYLAEIADDTDKLTGANDILADSLKEDSDAALLVARSIMSLNKGVEKLSDNWDEWGDILHNSSKESKEYYDALMGTKNAVADMFEVSSDFVKNDFIAEHLNEIEKAAAGDEKAIEKLRAALADDIIANIITTNNGKKMPDGSTLVIDTADVIRQVDSLRQWLADNPAMLEVGANLNTLDDTSNEFIDRCNEIIQSAGMTAEQANAFFDSMGFETTFETVSEPVQKTGHSTITSTRIIGKQNVEVIGEGGQPETVSIPSYETFTYPGTAYTYTDYVDAIAMEANGPGGAKVPKINSITRKATAPMNNKSSTNPGGGGKGGGGGGSQPKARTKEKERYHEIKSKIEQNAHALDMLNTAESRAYGQQKLDLMEEKIKLLEEQAELYKQLGQEAQAYFNLDKENLEKYGATFNDDNSIANYDEWYGEWVKKYLNNEISEEQMKEIDDYVKKYEDSLKELHDAEKKNQDTLNQIYDIKLEEVEYKLKTLNKLLDQSNKYLDYMIEQLDKSMYDTAEVVALLGQKVENVLQQAANEEDAIAGILRNHGLSDEEIQAFISGQADISQILEKVGTLTEEEVTNLQQHQDALLQYNETLIKLREESYAKISESIEEFNQKIERQISIIKDLDGVMGHYKNIIDIVGKDTLGISDEMLKQMDELSVTAAKSSLEISTDELNKNKAMLEEMYAREKELREKGLDADADLMQKEIEAQEDRVRELTESWASSWEDALKVAENAFLNLIKRATDAFSEAMAGQAKTLDNLHEYYDMQKTLQDRYLPTYQKIYELNKLTRDVNNAIDNTTNIKGKERLLQLQEDILKRQKDGVEVTEYEIGFLQRRLELEQARIAMEEAQNAKSMVRMTRDSEGNWSYTYTADSDKADAARQNYEDKLYELKKYNQESLQSFQDALLQATEDYKNKIAGLNLTDEERAQKIKEFQEEWVAHNKDMFQMAIDDAHWIIGEYNDGFDDLIDKFDETVLAHETGFESLEGYMNTFQTASDNMISEVTGAYQQWQIDYDAIFQAAGTTVDGFKDKVLEDMKEAEKAMVGDEDGNGGAVNAAKDMATEMKNVFDEILKNLKEWFSGKGGYSTQIDAITEKNKTIYQSIQSLITEYQNLTKAATDYANAPQGSGPQGGGGTSGATGGGKGGSGGGGSGGNGGGSKGGGGNAEPTYEYDLKLVSDPYGVSGTWGVRNKSTGKYIEISGNKTALMKKYPGTYNTGGYTGAWGPGGRLAVLHEKELVLNKTDTENMLTAVSFVRDLTRMISLNAAEAGNGLGSLFSSGVGQGGGFLDQTVTIHAEFPNATNHSEIEEAFSNLIGLASQYAGRRK